jgi:glycosyltransferase involved in cell wall biosynthesis
MDYPPNIEAVRWFGESIWPLIRQRRPDAEWWIVGRSPTRAVRELDNGRNIRVTGTVPDVEPYLERMRVSVAPLRLARGVQTKVLTAMAAGRPCVVTSCVAGGIEAEPDREVLVADSPAAFAEAVTGLLNDRQRAERIGLAGRQFVNRRYHPSRGLEQLEQLLTGG